MKNRSRLVSFVRNQSISSHRRARLIADICEPLERRLMLSGTTDTKYLTPTDSKVVLPSQTFKTNTGKKTVRTINVGSNGRGGPDATINVGPVVNISRAAGNQTEADIAINPTNPDQIFAVSNHSSAGLFSSRSNDGGATWTTAVIATGADIPAACCDARVEYDAFGNLFMVYLNSGASSNIVARSTNNGLTWTVVDTKTGGWDNPDLGVGTNNQIWVTARRTGGGGVAGYGAVSTGLGAPITFSAAQFVAATASTGSFGDIAVCNDGSILVSYVTPTSGEGPSNVPIWRDPDGLGPQGFLGAGGSTTVPILNTPTNVGGFDFMPAQDSRSVDPECSFAVVPPGRPFAGRVYFMYANETVNENHDHDIVIRYSDDNGLTWSGEVRVNNDPGLPTIRTQFLGQIAVDPTTGAVVVSWHDCRNDNGVLPNGTNAVANDDAQFYGALSVDGGLTWTNFQIDPGWSNDDRAANGIDYGDWTGSDYYGGRFFAVWASDAQGVNGLPNNPDPNRFDLATARVDIIGAGQPGIYGLVFDDANGNGARDGGELGLANVTTYIDANNNGQLDGGETSTLTVNGGSYSFTSLAAGTYVIRSVTPAGLRLTFPASGFYSVAYDGTSSIAGQDFGYVNPRVAGTVFDDSNDNGVFDSGEAGLSGRTVFIDVNNSGTLDGGDISTTTAGDGTYSFGGLADGTYIVRAVTPAGRRLTLPGGNGSYSQTVSPGNLVYTGRNFGMTDRVRISGFVYQDNNGNGSKDGGETGLANARVFQDLNNNGTFDNTGGTFNSTDVPKTINDNSTVLSNLVISGGGNINNLTVKFNITHTFDGDLDIFLISPIGTRVELTTDNGGTGENFINTVFDDAAATSITTGVAPFTGSFRPETPLSALNGQNANGTWKLEVTDDATQDVGTLTQWSITFGSTEPNVITPANGSYSFNGLSAGTYNMRQQALANYVFTSPAGGGTTVNPVGGDLVNLDFGNFATTYTGSQIYLRLDPTATNVQIWVDQPTTGAPTYTVNKNLITTLGFTGTAGVDSLTVDTLNGNPLPSGGISFDGLSSLGRGFGGDSLIVIGNSTAETFAFNSGSASINGISIAESNVENVQFDGKGGNDFLTVNGGPSVEIIATQHLQSFTMATAASASVSANGNYVIVAQALSMGAGATLDMNDNDMALFYSGGSPLATIVGLIKNARNGGAWDGTGITSTSAADRPAQDTSLGAMDAADYKSVYGANATFDGEPLAGLNAVLVKYTYYGDTDFNGKVDGADYARVDATFNQETGSHTDIGGWFNGDFDYNDKVDGADYALIDAAFNSQGTVL